MLTFSGSAWFYLVSFSAAFVTVFLLSPLSIRLAHRYNIFLDRPGTRRLHSSTTPRCGGVPVFIGFHIACMLCTILPGFSSLGTTLTSSWWHAFLLASSFLLLLGILDDALGLTWFTKLTGQTAVAVFMYWNGISVGQILTVSLPAFADFAATIIWFLVIINAFNLIDGLDGLASGLAAIAALGIAAILFYARKPADVVILTSFIGANLAFLRYNFHPAKIFLGDGGSMFLGFTLASLSLSTSTKLTMVSAVGVPLLAVGVPLFDTVLAIWRRSLRAFRDRVDPGRRFCAFAHADMEHLHHRLLNGGLNQRKAALFLYFGNAACVFVAVLVLFFNSKAMGIFFLAFIAGTYVAVRHLARAELWDSGDLIVRGFRRPSAPVVAALLYPALDFFLLNLCLLAALSLSYPDVLLKTFYYSSVASWCVIPFIAMTLSGGYSRVWSRARVSDFVFLAVALYGGIAVALAFSFLNSPESGLHSVITQGAIFAGLSGLFILGLRALPRAVRDVMEYMKGSAPSDGVSGRLLIYGAGLGSRLFLKNVFSAESSRGTGMQVIGFVDDDPNLRKRIVHGYRILGQGVEIPALVETHRIDRIVIACRISPAVRDSLVKFCRIRDISLTEWIAEEVSLVSPSAEISSTAKQPDLSLR